ncbi:MAG: hypothetical protein HN348_06040 [Proteobacteria bacterium]|jgi:hypothetical protein|nr:hypothetical protein [Pseudomonadota bacterium]
MFRFLLAFCMLFSATAAFAGDLAGMSANDYYKTFVYQDKDGGGWARNLHNSHSMAIPGADLTCSVSLYIFANGKFVAEYSEARTSSRNDGGHEVVTEKYIEGNWTVSGDKANLSGFGSLSGGGAKGVSLSFSKDISAPGIKGRSLQLSYLGTSVGYNALRTGMKRKGLNPSF